MSRLSESGGFPQVARLYAVALRELRNGGNADLALTAIRAYMEGQTEYIWSLQSGLRPKYLAVWNQSELVVLIDGMTTREQANALHSGYNASIIGAYQFPVNQVYQDVANYIGAQITAQGLSGNRDVTIAGYSMGGAVAQILLKDKLSYGWFGQNHQVVTFGSPRPSNSNVCHDINAAGLVFRWFTKNDPVPFIPFHADESLPFAIYAGRFNSINYGRFVHPREGLQAELGVETSYRMLPSSVAPITCTNLADYWLQWMTGTIYAHNLETFIAQIPLVVAPRQTSPPRLENQVEIAASHSPRVANAAERLVATAVVTAERQQLDVPLSIPKIRAFKAQRIGKIWGVYFGDTLIVVRPGRRVARHIARSGNEFMERLQTSAFVNPAALETQLHDYLAAASDPAGGFTPVMQIIPPG